MRLYVKSEYAATLALFRACGTDKEHEAETKMELITAYNAAISRRLYSSIKEGATAYQRHNMGRILDIYHMSTRTPGIIQMSTFCLINGKWEALSHSNLSTPADIEKRIVKGRYISIKEGCL